MSFKSPPPMSSDDLRNARELWNHMQRLHDEANKGRSAGERRRSLNAYLKCRENASGWMLNCGGLEQLLDLVDAQASELTRLLDVVSQSDRDRIAAVLERAKGE